MSTLTDIIDHVEIDLKDVTNLTWSTEDLTRAVRWALLELSWATPRRAAAAFTVEEGRREYALSTQGITAPLLITEVWHPYTAADPEYPPQVAPWRLLDDDTLFLAVDDIHAGDGVRVLYTLAHTIEGLDGATETTLSLAQEETVCLGAAGYAALQRAQQAIGQVNVTGQAPGLWQAWGQAHLSRFHARLGSLARREVQWQEPWAGGWEL